MLGKRAWLPPPNPGLHLPGSGIWGSRADTPADRKRTQGPRETQPSSQGQTLQAAGAGGRRGVRKGCRALRTAASAGSRVVARQRDPSPAQAFYRKRCRTSICPPASKETAVRPSEDPGRGPAHVGLLLPSPAHSDLVSGAPTLSEACLSSCHPDHWAAGPNREGTRTARPPGPGTPDTGAATTSRSVWLPAPPMLLHPRLGDRAEHVATCKAFKEDLVQPSSRNLNSPNKGGPLCQLLLGTRWGPSVCPAHAAWSCRPGPTGGPHLPPSVPEPQRVFPDSR